MLNLFESKINEPKQEGQLEKSINLLGSLAFYNPVNLEDMSKGRAHLKTLCNEGNTNQQRLSKVALT